MNTALATGKPNAAAHLEYAPLTGNIGAEVSGIDLSQPVDDEIVAAISAALVKYKVLVFREQPITTGQFRDFSLRFGHSEPYSIAGLGSIPLHPDYPEVAIIESIPGGKVSRADVWHTDVSFQRAPSFGSMLRCVVCPSFGGDTLWADMEAAYEGLDEATRSELAEMVVIHDWRYQRESARARGISEEVLRKLDETLPPAEHPLVRTHPVSGRKSIFAGHHARRIKGMGEAEGFAFLRKLDALATVPEYQCRLRWRKYTIGFWDNRSTQHYGVLDYLGQHRRMERVTFAGDVPF